MLETITSMDAAIAILKVAGIGTRYGAKCAASAEWLELTRVTPLAVSA